MGRWGLSALEDICEFIDRRGVTPKKLGSTFISAGYRVISAKNIKRREVDTDAGEQRFVDEATYRKWMSSSLLADDVLLTSEAPLGEPAYLSEDLEWCLGQRLFGIRTNKSQLYGRFLFYALQSGVVRKDLLSRATGATAKGIRQSELKRVSVPLPPLKEQKRIVAILDETFAAIETVKANTEKNIANAKELFESYLNGVFEKGGDGWEGAALDVICSKITDGVHKKPRYVASGIPFIKINNLTAGPGICFEDVSYISEEDHDRFCQRTNPEMGDILITKDGTIGIVRVIETDVEFSIFVSVALIKPLDKSISPYLKFVLESPLVQNQINPRGAALKHLYLRDLRKIIVPIAPETERNSLVHSLNGLQEQTRRLESSGQQKLVLLDNLKQSVLHEAFSGRLTADPQKIGRKLRKA